MTLVEKILKEALKLSVSERDELIESLLASRSAKEYKMTLYLESLAEEAREEREKKKDSEYFDSVDDFFHALN